MNREAAAAFLGLDARTVYARYRAGDIPAIRVGRVLRFDRAQLAAWKARQTVSQLELTWDRPCDIARFAVGYSGMWAAWRDAHSGAAMGVGHDDEDWGVAM